MLPTLGACGKEVRYGGQDLDKQISCSPAHLNFPNAQLESRPPGTGPRVEGLLGIAYHGPHQASATQKEGAGRIREEGNQAAPLYPLTWSSKVTSSLDAPMLALAMPGWIIISLRNWA